MLAFSWARFHNPARLSDVGSCLLGMPVSIHLQQTILSLPKVIVGGTLSTRAPECSSQAAVHHHHAVAIKCPARKHVANHPAKRNTQAWLKFRELFQQLRTGQNQ